MGWVGTWAGDKLALECRELHSNAGRHIIRWLLVPEVCAGTRKKIMLAGNAEKLRTVLKMACPWALMLLPLTFFRLLLCIFHMDHASCWLWGTSLHQSFRPVCVCWLRFWRLFWLVDSRRKQPKNCECWKVCISFESSRFLAHFVNVNKISLLCMI